MHMRMYIYIQESKRKQRMNEKYKPAQKKRIQYWSSVSIARYDSRFE